MRSKNMPSTALGIGAAGVVALVLAASLFGCASSGSENATDNSSNVEATEIESGDMMADMVIDQDRWQSFATSTTAAVLGDAETDAPSNGTSLQTSNDMAHLNTCFSPVSLYFALALCADGTDGQAQQQLLELLGVDDAESLQQFCKTWISRLEDTDDVYSLDIANSVWADRGYIFKPEFLSVIQDTMDASAFNADFGTSEADSQISEWISNETKGLLNPDIQTKADDVAKLINTIYFKDAWTDPFIEESTSDGTFHGESADQQVPFMHKDESSGTFAEGGNFTACQMPFVGGSVMTFYLPDEGVTPAQLLQDNAAVSQLYDAEFVPAEINWTVPKFTIDSSFDDLISALVKLGVTDIFDSSVSGMFANMIDTDASAEVQGAGDFYVSDVIQETHLALDEDGVEAAAYTSVGIRATGAMAPDDIVDFVLDRPFVYTLQSADGVTLFTGTVWSLG